MKQIRLWQQWQCGWTPNPVLKTLEPPLYAIVDDDIYDYLSQWPWYVIRGGYGAKHPHGFTGVYAQVTTDYGQRVSTMGRVVMHHRDGTWGDKVYHRDSDWLDNRYENLTYELPARRKTNARSRQKQRYM